MRFDRRSRSPDTEGEWTREELEAMDTQFVAALERAFELGLERRASAAGRVGVPITRTVRLSLPLPQNVWNGLLRSPEHVSVCR